MAKATVHDIAREAGVSLATVDRVLNSRPGVRAKTVAKVQDAISRLGYVRDTHAANLARRRIYRFVFLMPDAHGQFPTGLRNAISEAAQGSLGERAQIETVLVPSRDHTALVRALAAIDPTMIDGLAIMANETPSVRDAIARFKAHGVAVVSLVSDQPNSERDHFVGFDNLAAGRTAGVLLGRFVGGRKGSVVVVATTMQSRDMVERRKGFDQVINERFPNLAPLPSIEAYDDEELAERLTSEALAMHPNAVALYSVGASIKGIGKALSKQRRREIVCIDHELTANSRSLMESGLVDGVINQNVGHLARSALRVLRAMTDGQTIDAAQERIRIDIIIKENLP